MEALENDSEEEAIPEGSEEEEEEEMDASDADEVGSVSGKLDTKKGAVQISSTLYPNRPVTKEVSVFLLSLRFHCTVVNLSCVCWKWVIDRFWCEIVIYNRKWYGRLSHSSLRQFLR